jgi:hypothetical protein
MYIDIQEEFFMPVLLEDCPDNMMFQLNYFTDLLESL